MRVALTRSESQLSGGVQKEQVADSDSSPQMQTKSAFHSTTVKSF